uniref:PX domain-containing protein n=1 Tax=Sus scrofa TaxID=9823 RepID=A0A8D0P6I2_PIG
MSGSRNNAPGTYRANSCADPGAGLSCRCLCIVLVHQFQSFSRSCLAFDTRIVYRCVPNLWNVDGEVAVTEQKPGEVSEELASSYERKLIEVAEMHGELIEFNERLHRALVAKEALVSQMRQELIDLRGPVPGDLSQTSEDQSLSDFEISNRALINVWIPSVFLRGKAANAFHVYQVYIRIKDDEWNIYRRYTEFRSLHHKLQNKYPQVRAYNFPPKKAIGNKDAKFVEERRKQLQTYLRNVMNKVIQVVPEFAASPQKETLVQLMPFFL